MSSSYYNPKWIFTVELVKYLLKNKANVHTRSGSGGDTAFTLACENGHTDVAEVLLDAGSVLVRPTIFILDT